MSDDLSAAVLRPHAFGECDSISTGIRSGQPVVVDLRGVEIALARRVVDFASGVAFSLDATIRQIARLVYAIVPDRMSVDDDELLGLAG